MKQHSLKDCIQFFIDCKGWHTYRNDSATVDNICCGVNLGILKINEFNMCRIKSKDKAVRFIKYGKGT